MNCLVLGEQYITEEDRQHLSFCGEYVSELYIHDFLETLTISDDCLSRIAMYPVPKVLRYSILLAFAAMKSEDFPSRKIHGFSISIHSTPFNKGKVFLDVNNNNILYATPSSVCDKIWEICKICPSIFSDEYTYGDVLIASVLKACNDTYNNRKEINYYE